MNEALLSLKNEMNIAAARAYDRGIQTGNGGNLSVRIPGIEQMIIKSSGSSFIECSDESLILIDFNGKVLEGTAKPSREFLTHAAIYGIRSDVSAIMHCHAPWSIVMANFVDELPLVTHHMEMKLGRVPILMTEAHADTLMAQRTKEFLKEFSNIKAFIHRKHGLFSFGKTIVEAEHNAQLIEESSKIAFFSRLGTGCSNDKNY